MKSSRHRDAMSAPFAKGGEATAQRATGDLLLQYACAQTDRLDASPCHPERSEGPAAGREDLLMGLPGKQVPRFARNDRTDPTIVATLP